MDAAPQQTTPPPAPPPAAAIAAPAQTPPAAAPAATQETAPAAPAAPVKVETAPPPQPPAPAKPVEVELKLPDGAKTDPEAIGEFKKIMADDKLSPSQRAQAVLDLNFKSEAKNAAAWKAQTEKVRANDIQALKDDKEFGGPHYDKSVADAKAAAKFWGGEELSKLVEASGLDVHPAFVRAFARIQRGMAEDRTKVPGSQTPPPAKPPPMSQTAKIAARYEKKPA